MFSFLAFCCTQLWRHAGSWENSTQGINTEIFYYSFAALKTSLQKNSSHISETKMFLPEVKHMFASRTQMLLSKHMFPSLATTTVVPVLFQCCSLKMFPMQQRQANNGEVEVEVKGKKERNWKDKERELLFALYDCCRMWLMNTA